MILVQDVKRQKVDTEAWTGHLPATSQNPVWEKANAIPMLNTGSPSSADDTLRERYLQTYFKPKVNSVLQDYRKSRYIKGVPDWSGIAKRLKGVSVNTISNLRDDYHEGWKTWDGSAFTELAGSHSNNVVPTNIKEQPASPTTAPVFLPPSSAVASRSQVKLNLGHNAKANVKPKTRRAKPTEDYNPEDGEYTATKTVRTTSSLPSLHSAPPLQGLRRLPCNSVLDLRLTTY